MLYFVAAICVLLSLLYYYIFELKLARIKKMTSNMPSPKTYPIIGCSLEFGSRSDEILQGFQRIITNNGPVVAAWIGTELYVILSGVNEIQTILSSNKLLKKAHVYEFLKPWLGWGLLNSDGDDWRRQRKVITPAFHFKILESFVDMFGSNVDILTNKLEKEVGKPGFDIAEVVQLCAVDIISETSMGISVNAQLQKESKLACAINEIALTVLVRSLTPWLFWDTAFNLSSYGRKFNSELKIIHSAIDEIIANKRKIREKQKENKAEQKIDDDDDSVYGKKKRAAFLELLMDYNLTDDEIKSQVNTFMFAGQDTTSSAISFTLYCIMKYPEVQEKVYNEIKEVFGDSDKHPTYQDLKNLKYLDCVIDETQRLYPSVPYVGRKVTEDFQLTPEYILPKGCSINIFFYQLHRDPTLFSDPEVYNPDRFLPENSIGRHPYAFCPFSAGPRNCIGQKFALLEVKSIVSSVVRKFKLLPPINCPDVIVGSELVLKSITGINVKLEKR